MMNMEILEDFTASNDHMIVKGKRTKRLRPSSSTSSSGGGGGGAVFNYNSSVSSPTTSTSTEEDEDMANCLILLARGGLSQSEDEIRQPEIKFRSRKFTEMATATNGKVGIYVYECKTCGRAFSSFQALGGHRASHRKPKATAAEVDQRKSPPPPPRDDDDEEEERGKFNKLNVITPSTSTVTQLPVEIKSKIHECSICGSEFASGQALGGHMRRHRSAINSGGDSPPNDQKSRNMLALDLNLPAPAEDDHREAEFHQFSSNQQRRLVFSAAALVDCHY